MTNTDVSAAAASDALPGGPSKAALLEAVQELLAFIGSKPLDAALQAQLNDRYGPSTQRFGTLLALLRAGIDEGWACYAEVDGPDYRRGRIAEASEATHGFTVESAKLRNVKGNYHRHPRGEINMIGPVDPTGTFCGSGAGWRVFEANSSHYPTVAGGTVTFLFFLPGGSIEYQAGPA